VRIRLFEDWGVGLNDDVLARAMAGLGLTEDEPVIDGVRVWHLQSPFISVGQAIDRWERASWDDYGPRLLISRDTMAQLSGDDIPRLLTLLQRPPVQAAVTVEWWLDAPERAYDTELFQRVWRRPPRIGLLPDPKSQSLHKLLTGIAEQHGASLYTVGAGRDGCDLLLVPHPARHTAKLLKEYPVYTSLAVSNVDWPLRWTLGALQAGCHASGMVFLGAKENWAEWLDRFLSAQHVPIDRACQKAATGKPAALHATRAFLEASSPVVRRRVRTTDAASEILYFSTRHAEPLPTHRILVAEVGAGGFRAGEPQTVSVKIAPAIFRGPLPFPDKDLAYEPEGCALTVVLAEPRQLAEPVVGRLMLPPSGPSPECRLTVTPREVGHFHGRVLILHRNRVLQTGLLTGSVTALEDLGPAEPAKFAIEAVLRQDLSDLYDRNAFDAAILLNRYEDGTPTRTVVSADRAYVREMADVLEPTGQILKFLDGATRMEVSDCRQLLFRLAHQGVLLRDAIIDTTPRLATARRLQIVAAKPEAYLPVEFCYDGDAPDDGADLCSGFHADACPGCTRPVTSDLICPMAFWGLSKVIERHLHDPDVPYETGWSIAPEPTLAGKVLGHFAGSVLAASDRADEHAGTIKVANLQQMLKDTIPDAQAITSWKNWVVALAGWSHDSKPASLLVALPHTREADEDEEAGVAALEIAASDRLRLSVINENHVGPRKAVVLLLGCGTAGARDQANRFASRFVRKGAKVVMATTTAVLGRHAVPVALCLAEGLTEAARDGSGLGEVVRDMRRRFLRQDVPMGLAVVCYGDADWILGAE